MDDDKIAQTPIADEVRFGTLGFSVKLIAGLAVIVMTWLSLSLGIAGFGLFLYLHLLLRFHQAPLAGVPNHDVCAPLSGRVVALREDKDSLQIDIQGDLTTSQIIYAPLSAVIEDKLWIDGAYLSFDDGGSHPLNARYDFLLRLETGALASFSVFGGQWTRYIHAPFAEGQAIHQGEPFGFGLLCSLVTVQLPKGYHARVAKGDHLLARTSIMAQKS